MSYSLNSLKVVILAIIWRCIIGHIKGDTWSLDYGSYDFSGIHAFGGLELGVGFRV